MLPSYPKKPGFNCILQYLSNTWCWCPVFQFCFYKENGLLPETLTHSAHSDNLITLCSNCHGEFDSSVPALIIIPTDIEYFINWEENDYKCRTAAANAGRETPQRTVPSAEAYLDNGGKFKAYALRMDKKLEGEKVWTGSPTPMIFKASMGMLQPTSNVPLQQGCRIPENARVQFATLMQLYSRHIPQSTVSTTVSPSKWEEVDNTKRSITGGGKDVKYRKRNTRGRGEDADEISSRTRNKRPRANKKHLDSSNSYEGALPDGKQQKSLGRKRKCQNAKVAKEELPCRESKTMSGDHSGPLNNEPHWALGPWMSANDFIKTYITFPRSYRDC